MKMEAQLLCLESLLVFWRNQTWLLQRIYQDRVSKEKIGEGFFLNGLYYISTSSSFSKCFLTESKSAIQQQLWHKRLAHPSFNVLSMLFPSFCKVSHKCETCHMSKFTRLPFQISQSRATQPFEIIHSDVWGPASLESFDGYRFYVTFIDDFTRTTFVYLLKFKSEVFKCFQDFHNLVTNHFSSKICILRSDNGTEYTSKIMTDYLSAQGIIHQTSCVGTPQQNGIAERKNRDLLEKARALMLQTNVPKKFWSQGIQTAAYIINRLPSSVLNFKSPFEVLKGRKVDITHLRVFGCTCFVHVQSNHRDKFDPRAVKCVFLGYSSTQKGYKCYNSQTRKLFVSRDVHFDESNSFFQLSDNEPQGEHICDLFPTPIPVEAAIGTPSSPQLVQQFSNTEEVPTESNTQDDQQAVVPNTSQPRRNPPRMRHPPPRLQDYETYTTRYPLAQVAHSINTSSSHSAFLIKISKETEPRNFEEANQSPVWKKAMHDELKALDDNRTWSIVKLPKGQKIVGAKWIYKIKFNSDGSIERHKARLVARGFTQTFGVDYKETFAPVAKMNSVRVLLSVAINCGWSLYQMDVKNAFLHGDLEEDVYMRLPPGHPREGEAGMVCKLHKALYGLKQSPRAWYSKLSSVLLASSFKRSHADSSLFVRHGKAGTLVVLVYVDDLIITGDNVDEIKSLKLALHNTFAIKDLGPLKYFLGIEMDHSSNGMFLNQRKYVVDLLDEAGMKESKPARTPLSSRLKIDVEGEPLSDICVYQRLVGKLIYLTITRPDITYAVSLVSQFMHSPTTHHLQIVKRILRYLKGTVDRGIIMKNNGHFNLVGYSDSDWAGNSIDRKSTTGYCTFIGGNLVTWKSKKQTVVARSSAEAEYRAMASIACELIWLKTLLGDLGIICPTPITLHCDNQAAMHIAANPVFHERTKHIEVDCHFVRDQVQSKLIETVYTRSCDQLADIFTKILASAQFERLLSKLGSRDFPDPA
ncbi:putative RNA-directed DNA polymerase [Rosa chinensis]|uniref:Putative RNA-directed DNA polymerase n=1 Tax=Rosa chinensis TaxID=74649 RepID=A0A2P6P5H6_ROSCH|nr:putative RNA-directed DNA polymerase [Rosa chinensis]